MASVRWEIHRGTSKQERGPVWIVASPLPWPIVNSTSQVESRSLRVAASVSVARGTRFGLNGAKIVIGDKRRLTRKSAYTAAARFLCDDQYCSRYIGGTRGKGEVNTSTNRFDFVPCKIGPIRLRSNIVIGA